MQPERVFGFFPSICNFHFFSGDLKNVAVSVVEPQTTELLDEYKKEAEKSQKQIAQVTSQMFFQKQAQISPIPHKITKEHYVFCQIYVFLRVKRLFVGVIG